MILVTGYRTTIVRELQHLVGGVKIERYPAKRAGWAGGLAAAPYGVLAAGVLHPKKARDQSPRELAISAEVNLLQPLALIERHLAANPDARLVVIGSYSAERGSFDETYAAAKAGLQEHVRRRQATLKKTQRLTLVVPPIIADSGMTMARHDFPEVLARRPWCTAKEVADVVFHALFSPQKRGAWRVDIEGKQCINV